MEIGTREWVLAIKSERNVHDLDPVIRPESCKISTDISRWAKVVCDFQWWNILYCYCPWATRVGYRSGEFVPSATNLRDKEPQTHGYNGSF